jgi:hypothetical protein
MARRSLGAGLASAKPHNDEGSRPDIERGSVGPARHWRLKVSRSEGGSDQLRDTVPTEDDRGEAACDHREKKGRCDGVFHGKPSKQRAPLPRREVIHALLPTTRTVVWSNL